jgi:hypothetical protein
MSLLEASMAVSAGVSQINDDDLETRTKRTFSRSTGDLI